LKGIVGLQSVPLPLFVSQPPSQEQLPLPHIPAMFCFTTGPKAMKPTNQTENPVPQQTFPLFKLIISGILP
jgi:hypothetical protein